MVFSLDEVVEEEGGSLEWEVRILWVSASRVRHWDLGHKVFRTMVLPVKLS